MVVVALSPPDLRAFICMAGDTQVVGALIGSSLLFFLKKFLMHVLSSCTGGAGGTSQPSRRLLQAYSEFFFFHASGKRERKLVAVPIKR